MENTCKKSVRRVSASWRHLRFRKGAFVPGVAVRPAVPLLGLLDHVDTGGHRHPGKEPRERKRVVFGVVHRGVLGI